MASVSIARHEVVICGRSFKRNEKIEAALLDQISPELDGYLQPGETRACAVARAIRRLGIYALRECLAGETIIKGEKTND